jgi:hypothetical protein
VAQRLLQWHHPAVASSTFSPTVELKGLFGTPRTFSREDLMALVAETVQVSYLAGQGTDIASFTGTRLLNVFDAAGRRQAAERHQQRQTPRDCHGHGRGWLSGCVRLG